MVKVISQEAFDNVVCENIVEFTMSVDEAKQETIQQLTAQGINLKNIITDLAVNTETGKPLLIEALENIAEINKVLAENEELHRSNLLKLLDTVIEECNKSVPHRIFAVKNNATDLVLYIVNVQLNQNNLQDFEVLCKAIDAFIAMVNKQPDIFNEKQLDTIQTCLARYNETDVVCGCLEWLQKCCVLHENNRQLIMGGSILSILKEFIKSNEVRIIKDCCTLYRYLILDDDIRLEFGKAHDHARMIAGEMLSDLTKLLTKFKSEQDLLCDLLLTIASLTVRNELCLVVEEAGGLKFILDAMVEFPDSVKLNREALKLLKALAGNDTVKVQIIQQGAAPLIESLLNRHKANDTFAKTALACISTVSLRVIENSKALFDAGISETIVQTMKIHPKDTAVQRNGAWAMRNMVSRSRDQCDTFISLGAEEVLNTAYKEHPSINQDIKAALRDLGCKVHLIEEWKGVSEIKILDN